MLSEFIGRHGRAAAHALLGLALCMAGIQGVYADNSDIPEPEWTKHIAKWRFQTSIATRHRNPREEHDTSPELINIELWLKNNWHGGVAFLENSYNQPTQYLYVGKAWDIFGSQHFYWRLTGGLIHGYVDEHEDKVPLNYNGFSPGIIPAIGAKYKNVFTEVQAGGISVIMWTVGFSIDN